MNLKLMQVVYEAFQNTAFPVQDDVRVVPLAALNTRGESKGSSARL